MVKEIVLVPNGKNSPFVKGLIEMADKSGHVKTASKPNYEKSMLGNRLRLLDIEIREEDNRPLRGPSILYNTSPKRVIMKFVNSKELVS